MDGWATTGSTTARFANRTCGYIYDQEATRDERAPNGGPTTSTTTTCYMEAGSAGELGGAMALEQVGFWRKVAGASEL